jgi:hypothetical protein
MDSALAGHVFEDLAPGALMLPRDHGGPFLRAAGLVLFSVLIAACAPATRGASVLAYAEGDGGLALFLSRKGGQLLGVWEEAPVPRRGSAWGKVAENGDLTLDLSGPFGSGESRRMTGRLVAGEAGIEGSLEGADGKIRHLSLRRDPAVTAGFALRAAEAGEEEIPGRKDRVARFSAAMLEPLGAGAFETWYSCAFLDGSDAMKALSIERDAFLAYYRAEAAELIAKFGPDGPPPWQEDSTQFIAFRRGSLLVVAFSRYSYRGGAHGTHELRYSIVDTERARILGRGDIFRPGTDEELSRRLEAAARAALGLPHGAPLSSTGLLFSDRIPPTDNIFPWSGGLGFHYGAYELAPYAAGDIEIVLPWEAVRDILKPGTPLLQPSGS